MYLALYRKYRPGTFDDVISQEHITTTLKNQISTGQIAHAYLFTGTRGTGKTSCAKIMAKAVNCLSPENGNPCGKCEACRAIESGSTDIIEIDAASNNGVDSIRQIRDEVVYTPIDCKYKVYIIDEVHMLTGSAFNALLKTLEEPPSHVIFILATTEYYKVPATILSRCQQFLFSKIDPVQSAQRLSEIAAKENITLAPEAAALIARLSDGAMRDALSLLDQCISMDNKVDEETVRRCSGSADSGYLFAVSRAAIEEKPADALAILDKLITQGKDLNRFIEELTLHYRNLMLIKTVGRGLVKASDDDLRKYEEQCGKYSLDEIMRHIDLISDSLDNINRMRQTGQARLLTEQLLIRITSPKLTNDASALAARIGALEERVREISKYGIAASVDRGVEVGTAKNDDIVRADSAVSVANSVEVGKADSSAGVEKSSDVGKADSITGAARSDDVVKIDSGFFDGDTGFDDIPLPPPPAEELGGFSAEAYEPQAAVEEGNGGLPPAADKETINNSKSGANKPKTEAAGKSPLPKKSEEKNQAENAPNISEKEQAADFSIKETDFELPEGTAELPQWNDVVSGLSGSSGRLLKNSKAYLYNGIIYLEASTSAKTVFKNSKKASSVREKTAEILGGSFELLLLREHNKSLSEKEDKITPFLDKARSMGIEVTVKER